MQPKTFYSFVHSQAIIANSIVLIAALSHFASAQIVAPERSLDSDPFGSPTQALESRPLSSSRTLVTPLDSVPIPKHNIHQLGTSTPGGFIASVPCDPYMTAEQESRILATLQMHDETDWDGISLKDLKTLLKNRVGIWLDQSAISEVGIAINEELATAANIVAGPLGDRLDCLLSNIELGYTIRANRLEITSEDKLDERTNTRIYDVTPLVLRIRSGQRIFDFDSLSNLIHQSVAPDSWIVAGGVNVINTFVTGTGGSERGLIVVTAPYSVQLQLLPLIERLNITSSANQTQTLATPYIKSSQLNMPTLSKWSGGQF